MRRWLGEIVLPRWASLIGCALLLSAIASLAGAAPCVDTDADTYVDCTVQCDLQPGQSCGDCDNGDSTIHPGATDTTCNGIDDDCDSLVDEGFPVACQCTERWPFSVSSQDMGLIGWWSGEGNGFARYGGNTTPSVGAVTYASGMVGQSFSFNGSSALRLALVNVPVTAQLTLEAWIRPDDVSTYRQIISKFGASGNYAYQIGLATGGVLRADLSGNGVSYEFIQSGPSLLAAGTWAHVALTFNSGAARLYVNGNRVASSAPTFTSVFAGGPTTLELGRDPVGIQYFLGRIDEPAVYNRALSDAAIRAIFNAGSAGMCPCTDWDGDGYGPGGVLCGGGTVADCGEYTSSIHPGADDQTCNGLDEDCDVNDGPPATGVVLGLRPLANKSDLVWNPVSGATLYDVVKGELLALRSSGGNFTTTLTGCVDSRSPDLAASDPAVPSVATGYYYLARHHGACDNPGTYDSGSPSQAGSRDAEIAQRNLGCGDGECAGDNPANGYCTASSQCGLGFCDFSTCIPRTCHCSGSPGIWFCSYECGGHCI